MHLTHGNVLGRVALGCDALLEPQRNAILVSPAAVAFVFGAMI